MDYRHEKDYRDLAMPRGAISVPPLPRMQPDTLGKVQVEAMFHGFDDMLTVNPYLGTDGVKPFVDVQQ